MTTRIKFCGLTEVNDIKQAVQAGADALGFVFYEPSPRAVTIAQAQVLIQHVPAFVSIVALVVNPKAELIKALHALPIDLFQFHGEEAPVTCANFAENRRWIKAIQVKNDQDLSAKANQYIEAGACGVLLDGYDPAQPEIKGGTGHALDWKSVSAFSKNAPYPVILAGGLTPENVTEAISQTACFAVDVSGGIERIDNQGKKMKGKKDLHKMQSFALGVSQAHAQT